MASYLIPTRRRQRRFCGRGRGSDVPDAFLMNRTEVYESVRTGSRRLNVNVMPIRSKNPLFIGVQAQEGRISSA